MNGDDECPLRDGAGAWALIASVPLWIGILLLARWIVA